MELLSELNRAMEYIEANITDEEALSWVAKVTSYSSYHFQRIFNYIADMPLSEYIRRRKMSLAAMELQSGSEKVIDLAVKYGYDSADSFSRAFVKQHGITPTAARRSGTSFELYSPLTFQIQIRGVQKMNWRIEEKEAFEVFGIEKVFTSGGENKVPAFWEETEKDGSRKKLTERAKGQPGPNAVCGPTDPATNTFTYVICFTVREGSNTDGYKVVSFPKQTWAVLRDDVKEYGEKIPELFGRAYGEWLPNSGYKQAGEWDMEIYGCYPDGRLYEEVWIPVAKK